MPSYQYRKSHCGDKTVVRSSYLHNRISYTGNMSSLYWIGGLVHIHRTGALIYQSAQYISGDQTNICHFCKSKIFKIKTQAWLFNLIKQKCTSLPFNTMVFIWYSHVVTLQKYCWTRLSDSFINDAMNSFVIATINDLPAQNIWSRMLWVFRL